MTGQPRWPLVTALVLILLTWGAGNALAAPLDQGPDVYVVQAGDTLSAIALRYHTTIEAIVQLNDISDPGYIYIGQRLLIPGTGGGSVKDTPNPSAPRAESTSARPTVYVVEPGDTLSGIALRFGTTVAALEAANGISSSGFIYVGQRLVVPETGATSSSARPVTVTHIVQAGETLGGIGLRYGVSAAAIARVNGLADASYIYPGQRLIIPVVGASTAAAAAGPKRVEIDISDQRMYVWQGDTLIYEFVISTGQGPYQTRRGVFPIKSKLPMAYSSAYNLYMPNWLGLYDVGRYENGIHGLPTSVATGRQLWAGVLGQPVSFGCVVMDVDDVQLLYNWAELGTPVEIHD